MSSMKRIQDKMARDSAIQANSNISNLTVLNSSELATIFQNMIDHRPFTDVGVKTQNLAALQGSMSVQSKEVRRAYNKVKETLKDYGTALAGNSALFTESDAKAMRAAYRNALKATIQELRTIPIAEAANLTDLDVVLNQLKQKGNKVPDRIGGRFEIMTDVPLVITNLYGPRLEAFQKYFRTYDFHNAGYHIVGGQALLGVISKYSSQPLSQEVEDLLELLNTRHNLAYSLVSKDWKQAKGSNIHYYWIMRESVLTRLVSKSAITADNQWSVFSSKFDNRIIDVEVQQYPTVKEDQNNDKPGVVLSIGSINALFLVLNSILHTSPAAPSLNLLCNRINSNPTWIRYTGRRKMTPTWLSKILCGTVQINETGSKLAEFKAAYYKKYGSHIC